MHQILAINIGSTSSKIAYFDGMTTTTENIKCDKETLQLPIFDQQLRRKKDIQNFLNKHNIDFSSIDAVVCRGGHTEPLSSGIYHIDKKMIDQMRSMKYGHHACDLGALIVKDLTANTSALSITVDPPVTDEYSEIAKISGHSKFSRKSCLHALSHKATAKKFSKEMEQNYESLSLITVHLGGGISIVPHMNGRMVDGNNAIDGDGPFSTNRSGSLPTGDLVRLCFSGQYTQSEIETMLNGEGGVYSYLGSTDIEFLLNETERKEEIGLILDAMIYQVSKEIGAMSTVLKGRVDAILITGGIAHSEKIIKKIQERVSFIAPIAVYPGENEIEALIQGAISAVENPEIIKTIP